MTARKLCRNCFASDEGCAKCNFTGFEPEFVPDEESSDESAPPSFDEPGSEVQPVSAGGISVAERKAIIENDSTDELLRAFVSRYGDDLEERTASFRRIASAARAETEALLAIHELTMARRHAAIPVQGAETDGGS